MPHYPLNAMQSALVILAILVLGLGPALAVSAILQ
jgi:hypothetical protein